MEEIEVPIEDAQEHIHHAAHGATHDTGAKWIMMVALSSAFLAAFAAVGSLMAGHHSNEAMIEQIQASDAWSFFQAKGIKASVLQSKIQLFEALEKPVAAADKEKLEEYKKEQDELKDKAAEKEKESGIHLARHVTLARSVTLFQVAIAIAAISVLTKRRKFWYLSLGFGFFGLFFLILGLI